MHGNWSEDNTLTHLNSASRAPTGSNILRLLKYWEDLRAGRAVPLRSEIDPRKIGNLLDASFILEQTNSGGLRFRLAGTGLCDSMGMDLRGIPAFAIINPNARETFEDVLSATLTPPAVSELSLTSQTIGGADVQSRMLLLPLASDDGEINRILGCVTAPPQALTPPMRYDIVGAKSKRIITGLPVSETSSNSGFQERSALYRPELAGPLGQLTSIKGDATGPFSGTPENRPKLELIQGGLGTKKAP